MKFAWLYNVLLYLNFFSKKGEFLFCKDYNIKTVITTCHNFTLTWYTCTHFLPDFIHLSNPFKKQWVYTYWRYPKINQSIDFIWKLWISVNFTKTNTANPLTLGLYRYLLWNTLTWAWQYFTKSKLSFWNLYFKKKRDRKREKGGRKTTNLKKYSWKFI